MQKHAAELYKERCLVAKKPHSFVSEEEKQEIIKSLPYLRKGKLICPRKMKKELAEKIVQLDSHYTNKELASLLIGKDDMQTGILIVLAAEKTINRRK